MAACSWPGPGRRCGLGARGLAHRSTVDRAERDGGARRWGGGRAAAAPHGRPRRAPGGDATRHGKTHRRHGRGRHDGASPGASSPWRLRRWCDVGEVDDGGSRRDGKPGLGLCVGGKGCVGAWAQVQGTIYRRGGSLGHVRLESRAAPLSASDSGGRLG